MRRMLLCLLVPCLLFASRLLAQPQGQSAINEKIFVQKAAEINLGEVSLGQLAAARAESAEIRKFGQRLATDHHKANEELKKVAMKQGIALPASTDQKFRDIETKLSNLKGAEFDREFLEVMITEHKEVIPMFQAQSQGGRELEITNYATNQLPGLREYLQQAEKLQGKRHSQ